MTSPREWQTQQEIDAAHAAGEIDNHEARRLRWTGEYQRLPFGIEPPLATNHDAWVAISEMAAEAQPSLYPAASEFEQES